MATHQLPLFPDPPAWWTPADSDVCRAYHAEEVREGPPEVAMDDPTPEQWAVAEAFLDSRHPRMEEYTCRRCDKWTSADGREGICEAMVDRWREDYVGTREGRYEPTFGMPEPPDRSKCVTGAGSMCEEWDPRE